MKRLSAIALFVFSIVVPFVAFSQFSDDAKAQLKAAINCKKDSKDPLRAFCAVNALFDSTWGKFETFMPTQDLTSNLGIGVFIPSGKQDIRKLLLEKTHLVVLHVSTTKAKITVLTPSNEQEAQELAQILGQVAVALKQQTVDSISISKSLDSFFASERKKTLHALMIGDGSGALEASKMRTSFLETRLNNGLLVYLAREEAQDGVYLSLFPKLPLIVK